MKSPYVISTFFFISTMFLKIVLLYLSLSRSIYFLRVISQYNYFLQVERKRKVIEEDKEQGKKKCRGRRGGRGIFSMIRWVRE